MAQGGLATETSPQLTRVAETLEALRDRQNTSTSERFCPDGTADGPAWFHASRRFCQ